MAYPKDPSAILDYKIDWSKWLGTDTISSKSGSVTWSVPKGLTTQRTSNNQTSATIWLSGGSLGSTYHVRCKIVTTAGRTDERSFDIFIMNR